MIEYRKVLIAWHDAEEGEEDMLTEVAITSDWEEEIYPNIFFYFSDLEDFEQAKQPEPNGFEFTLREENE